MKNDRLKRFLSLVSQNFPRTKPTIDKWLKYPYNPIDDVTLWIHGRPMIIPTLLSGFIGLYFCVASDVVGVNMIVPGFVVSLFFYVLFGFAFRRTSISVVYRIRYERINQLRKKIGMKEDKWLYFG